MGVIQFDLGDHTDIHGGDRKSVFELRGGIKSNHDGRSAECF